VTTPKFAARDWIIRAAHEATNMIQSNCKFFKRKSLRKSNGTQNKFKKKKKKLTNPHARNFLQALDFHFQKGVHQKT
jgi:cell division protein FtsB